MNAIQNEILLEIYQKGQIITDELSDGVGYPLEIVKENLKILQDKGKLSENYELTNQAMEEIENNKPKSAIILAAGLGLRMTPINSIVPKALLEVNNQTLVERLITQLQEVGIFDIKIVVGFLKEKFEFLIDKYDVELVISDLYKEKNNLFSLSLVSDYLKNTYIIPADLYCRKNPFRTSEYQSWYALSSRNQKSYVNITENQDIYMTHSGELGKRMIGISYINTNDSFLLKSSINNRIFDPDADSYFWERCLENDGKYIISARVFSDSDIIEINTYEQLRELDTNSPHLKDDAIEIIKEVFDVDDDQILNIRLLKKGMTNRSFIFNCLGKNYIMRIPGDGTEELIDRTQEYEVYTKIRPYALSDKAIYINSQNGYKITEFIEDSRSCNPTNENDLILSIKQIKRLHDLNLQVEFSFNLFEQIEYYESLWEHNVSIYEDYLTTKENIYNLKNFVEDYKERYCLTHIDANCDNILFTNDRTYLIDWEYAAMQDPHLDIAMFCIYALYSKNEVDHFIDLYFDYTCSDIIRLKIYAYIAISGLLWSNWCEYKLQLGIEFGEYSSKQYGYAKEYYRFVSEMSTNQLKEKYQW